MDPTEEKEKQILGYLASAWNDFIQLPPTHLDDKPDFRRAIHECQRIICMRQMRRIDPEQYPEIIF